MRHAEIEFWALGIIDTVTSGGRVEDSRVELKAEWPGDPAKAARRLAGHANAARGEEILWLIGVDERRGLVGVNPDDLAKWWSTTSAFFDGPIPGITPVTVYKGMTVLALLIETAYAPFVIKNPAFGAPNGGPVELEVPWREMTSIRSARHGDLIRMLVPQSNMPSIEVLNASLVGNRFLGSEGRAVDSFGPNFKWQARAQLYVVPRNSGLLVFPAHLVKVVVREASLGELELGYFATRYDGHGLIADSAADMVVEGPSRINLQASADYDGTMELGDQATLVVFLTPAGSDRHVVIRCELAKHNRMAFKSTRSFVSTS
jgi:hypothetical protein